MSSLLRVSFFVTLGALLAAVSAAAAEGPSGAHPVKVVKDGNGYRLTRDGQPYFIRGAGGDAGLKELAAAGGNSLRTWGGDNLGPTLDEAQKLGLTVTVGIWLGHENQGFHYDDAKQVADQYEHARQIIEQYKDHPAVLMWGIGNEMEGSGDNGAVWSAINNIASMAKKLDPNHPTMTVVAEIGGNKVRNMARLCPDIDILGINSYGGAPSVAQRYRKAGAPKPYVLTEFGPAGTWEVGKTSWGVAPELTSTEKAGIYKKVYDAAVSSQKDLCLGSYVFAWGHKQEATATWFGMFLPDGSRLAVVDTMQELWSGKPAEHPCPKISSLKLDGPDQVEQGATVRASLSASGTDSDPLKVRWVLQKEPSSLGTGGEAEAVPPVYPEAILQGDLQHAEVRIPANGGGYRLFAYVSDTHGGAAVGNIPLFAKGMEKLPEASIAKLPLLVYGGSGRAPYVPTGWMGNVKAIKIDPASTDQPHAGKTCMRVDYEDPTGWGGVVWQSPENDWGNQPGGWNLTGAKQLTFWARGAKGGEVVSFQFGLLGRDKKFYDTASGKLEKVSLTDQWQKFIIDLKDKDLKRIKTGFCWVAAADGKPITFYLDDIRYE